MDEKGFLLGKLHKTKRIVNKKATEIGKLLGSGQDGNREWISLLATICMDHSSLPPSIIYQAQTGNLQDTWLEDFEPDYQTAFFASSPNGWTSDNLGYAWLTQVFDRFTRSKARHGRDYRLLFVDGHSSHINMRFLNWCEKNRVLVAVYPPHSTHRLQPLDLALFSPLANYYQQELDIWIYETQGLSGMSKRRFWSLFWPAWLKAFTPTIVESAWKQAGLQPLDAEVVLRQLKLDTGSRPSTNSSRFTETDWRRARRQITKAVSEEVAAAMVRVQTEVQLLRCENEGLREQLRNEKRRRKRGKPLFNNVFDITKGNAMFFSPTKIAAAQRQLEQQEYEKQEAEIQKAQEKARKQRLKKEKEQKATQKKLERQQAKLQKAAEREEAKREKEQRQTMLKAAREQRKQARTPVQKASKRGKRASTQQLLDSDKTSDNSIILVDSPIARPQRRRQPPARLRDDNIQIESYI